MTCKVLVSKISAHLPVLRGELKEPSDQQVVNEQSENAGSGDMAKGGAGTNYSQLNSTQVNVTPQYRLTIPQPLPTTTNSQGSSHGGSLSTTTSQYQEQTVTNGQAFSNSEAWATATAVDSAHAADLWFTYTVSNAGTDYANEIGNLTFNVYIGDDPNPVYTYYAAPEIGGDGELHNFMPGESHTYTSHHIPLNLDQMKAIDLGQPLRIELEDYSYGADEQFYQDAAASDIQISIDDGPEDGDQTLDTYLLPTWGGSDTVLDVMARYFPNMVDANGALTAIWTPEFRSDVPSWCTVMDPQHPVVTAGGQTEVFCKHALSTADWWNIYTSGMGDGREGLQSTTALPNSVALFRFNQDSDGDGYSDATELQLGTDPNNPASFPHPELLAGVNNIQNGNNVTSTLSLLNTGLYDAYGVEAVMVAPDDSITITNNTVGGSGRVKALKQVVVGSSIQPPAFTASNWTGTAQPAAGGYFTGATGLTYTFTVDCTTAGGCDVGSGAWTLDWSDSAGNTGALSFGSDYQSPNLLAAGSLGVQVSLLTGHVSNGNSFTVQANPPSDTFQYTINRTPYTPPLVLVSYNDPQGVHRFIIPPAAMALASPTDNLAGFAGQMLQDPGVQLVTTADFAPGPNTTNLVVNNPSSVSLTNAKLFLDFIDPTGTVVREESLIQTLTPGPSVVPVAWDTGNFSPAYVATQDYIVMAFWTDYQGNILATGGRPLSSFQVDPKPDFAMSDQDASWDFGTAAQGALLERTFSFANTGQMELLTYVEAPAGVSVSQTGSHAVDAADLTSYAMNLNTANLPLGVYDETITIHTSDPANPTRTVHITGNITTGIPDTAPGSVIRPLDYTLNLTGSGNQGDWITFTTPDLGLDSQSIQPVKIYSQDYSTLWGVGKYATDFGGTDTTSMDIFGDGIDGDLTISTDTTLYPIDASCQGTIGTNALDATNASFQPGQMILIDQSRGDNSGAWEINEIASYSNGIITTTKLLKNSYVSDGVSQAQVLVMKQYHNITINPGVTLSSKAWDGNVGGILPILSNGTVTILGTLSGAGVGFRGGSGFIAGTGSIQYPGEGTEGVQVPSKNSNGNGGGGGQTETAAGANNEDAGAGGGNGTAGVRGAWSWSSNQGLNAGGQISGTDDLTLMTFGGAGGKAGSDYKSEPGFSGDGANGGGIIIIIGEYVNISGSVDVSGNSPAAAPVQGGAGAGGSVYIEAQTASIGTNQINIAGGTTSQVENGSDTGFGYGGIGRIRLEYCEFFSGSTSFPLSSQKLSCYIAEQGSDPTTTSLNLPESFTNGQTYQIQYGRMLTFSTSGVLTTTLRVPAACSPAPPWMPW